MPKATRPATSQRQYRISPIDIQNRQDYYTNTVLPSQANMQAQNPPHNQPQTLSSSSGILKSGPIQHQTSHYQVQPTTLPMRASSGAWTPQDDTVLMNARAQGMNWGPIQTTYFPSKTSNACRKRHERLMDRRNADDWDNVKLEVLAKEYMAMRRDIWSQLAAKTGEKWGVVEAKVCKLSHHLRISPFTSKFFMINYKPRQSQCRSANILSVCHLVLKTYNHQQEPVHVVNV